MSEPKPYIDPKTKDRRTPTWVYPVVKGSIVTLYRGESPEAAIAAASSATGS
jgi:hypothetical protein